ncbi:SUKH-4 family immunity protein [Umezawaea tangerina]|uniref:SUKH-4 immunity protein of toxin-antitoxin system n=1 Tax=Umezawaea tangerina TaxID=84725 RepID=A0A2T0TFU5_9PSEU|nr:SUKH-4 family immunity protein [Umezawaea tangerina]PRY44511.1 SUKH-4 immunity protein of toxin-antitoxin system [Umezawaea tangerina]
MDDAQLLALLSQRGTVPYPGTWSTAPLPLLPHHNCTVIARDDGISTLAVDRQTGHVHLYMDDDTEPHLVNSDIPSLIACSLVYERASAEVDAMEDRDDYPDDDDDDEDVMARADAFTEALMAELRSIDAPAVTDPESLWSTAAEELGYAIPV